MPKTFRVQSTGCGVQPFGAFRTSMMQMFSGRMAVALCLAMVSVAAPPAVASAQTVSNQSVADVLTFLLINRSIRTDEFSQDGDAATATTATLSDSLRLGLNTLPIGSAASAFTYRVNPNLGGLVQRSSSSFGPFITDRSLTVGRNRASVGASFQHASFTSIDGRSLTDGTLVAIYTTVTAPNTPTETFDVENLTLRIKTDTVNVSGSVGLSDRLDIGAVLPLVRLSLEGERVDIYRGSRLVQASATSTASGVGDVALRVKYNVVRDAMSGLSIGAEARLPTGSEENLLGTGEFSLKPRVVWSYEQGRVAVDTDLGYAFGGLTGELDYGGAVTFAGTPRLVLVGELSGARLNSLGRLTTTTTNHPTLTTGQILVQTTRLSSTDEGSNRLTAVAGVKWNPASTWLVSGSVLRTLTSDGVTAGWVPTAAVEYSFGR